MIEHVKEKIADFLGNRKIQAKGKVEELQAIEASVKKSILEAEIMELNKQKDGNLGRAVQLIPALLDVKAIFKKATIFQKHSTN